jgi:hypothetical protein
MAEPGKSEYHARNATPDMLYDVADYLAALDAAVPSAAGARGPNRRPIFDLVLEGAKAPDQNYVATATHAVAFDAGGVAIQTMLVILPPTEDPASARVAISDGFIKGVTDSGGTATAIDTLGGEGAADYAIAMKGRPFGHVLIRQRGRHLLLVNAGSRYVLPDAASRERLLAPKLEALSTFVPELVPAAPAE